MDELIYAITLEDGSIINDLRLNGNNFISKKEIKSEIFDGNLGVVIINDGKKEIKYQNMILVQITKMEEEYWFVLREMSEQEIRDAKMRSDIDYLSMMTEIEI